MARKSNYEKSIYNEYEKVLSKLDIVLEELSDIKKQHKKEIEKLTKELEKANELIEKLQEENDRLKNKNNKNSSNSSKPSSTDISKPKKSGANLYNYRRKTNNKPGGQYGHKGHNLSKEEIERKIRNKELKVKTICHTIKGNSKKEPLIKYKIELEIKPYVEKHIFKYDENSNGKLPKEYKIDVTYGNSIKSLYIELGAYNVISYNRFSDFLSVITNKIIQISEGTLVNFIKEFSYKSKLSIDNLINNILNSTTTYTDETSSKFCKKKMFVRNYSNEETVVYKAHLKKGHGPIKEDDILTKFLGGIIGDHDTTLYSYGTKNYECNIHLGRYLEELKQNIPDTLWPFRMYELIFRINNTRKIAKKYNLNCFEKDKVKEYEKEYDEIIKLAKEEKSL